MEELHKNIEAILFAAENPVSVADLLKHLNKDNPEPLEENQIISIIQLIQEKYQNEIFHFKLAK
jgi:chromosome segregation and condensation protein ScpB